MTIGPLATIWDMDGTLLDTEALTMQCWERACEEHGYRDVKSVLLKLIGRTARDSDSLLLQELGNDFPVERVRVSKNQLAQAHFHEHGVPVKAGVHPTLTWLQEHKVPCAVASSTQREKVLSHLNSSTLMKYFQCITGGDEVRRSKPDPEIFVATAGRLHVNPRDCVVFEDSFNGVIAAHAAGMRVVMVPDLLQPTPEILQLTHKTLLSLEEAIPLLHQLLYPEQREAGHA